MSNFTLLRVFLIRHKLFFSLSALLFSALSVYVSWSVSESTKDATNQIARINLYIDFKKQYKDVKSNLPPSNITKKPDFQGKHWRAYEDYWSHSFDEWFATNHLKKLSGGKSILWDDYYSHAIKNAASKINYQEVLCFQINGGSSYATKREEFKKALNKLTNFNIECLNQPTGIYLAELLKKYPVRWEYITGKLALNHNNIIDLNGTVSVNNEIDNIFMMLAYSIVYKGWQDQSSYDSKNSRGHNIGSVLVNNRNKPVFWARNASRITNDSTQHGEVRTISNYLKKSKNKYLKGFTIYTTLEPCIMCSGMISMTKLSRVVFGQKDPLFGGNDRRLKAHGKHDEHSKDEFVEYPRIYSSIHSMLTITKEIDTIYNASGRTNITEWLRSNTAKMLYKKAYDQFLVYKVIFPENKPIYDKTLKYLNYSVTSRYYSLNN